jgi:hypothetical protein
LGRRSWEAAVSKSERLMMEFRLRVCFLGVTASSFAEGLIDGSEASATALSSLEVSFSELMFVQSEPKARETRKRG